MFFISKRKFEERVMREVEDLRHKDWIDRRHWDLAERVSSLEIEIKKLKGEPVNNDVVAPKML